MSNLQGKIRPKALRYEFVLFRPLDWIRAGTQFGVVVKVAPEARKLINTHKFEAALCLGIFVFVVLIQQVLNFDPGATQAQPLPYLKQCTQISKNVFYVATGSRLSVRFLCQSIDANCDVRQSRSD
jgi:hypothetical protein